MICLYELAFHINIASEKKYESKNCFGKVHRQMLYGRKVGIASSGSGISSKKKKQPENPFSYIPLHCNWKVNTQNSYLCI